MVGSKHHPVIRHSEFKVMKEDRGHPQVMTDAEQKVLDANDRFLLMSGFSLKELITVHLQDILHPEDRERFAEHWHVLTEHGSSSVTVRLQTKGEFTVHARFQSERLKTGEIRTVMLGTAGERFPEVELRVQEQIYARIVRDRPANDIELRRR